jgi:CubicO group peptidase (beta-lactamase class C family)
LAPLSLVAQTPTDNPLRTRTDSVIHTAVTTFFAQPCHVGLSLALLDHDASRFYDYGTTSKDRQRLPTRHTIYEIASITKTFTGSLVAKALLDGRMDLDADIRTYLTESYPNLEYHGQGITLRHLSTHQSGLGNIPPWDPALFKNPDFENLPYVLIKAEQGYDRARILRELHEVRLDTLPGSIDFKYSNTGTKIVSFALENLYHLSYPELIRRFITAPLGMSSTALSVLPRDSARLATPYSPGGRRMAYLPDAFGAAGGIKSTTSDMVKYLAWHLHEQDPIVVRAHQPLVGTSKGGRGINWWLDSTATGTRRLAMSGGAFGMSSNLVLFPDDRMGVILLANDGCPDTQGALGAIANTIFEGFRTEPHGGTQ